MTYAKETTVSAESSRAEIERTLRRYGATSFGYGWNPGAALVEFEASGRRIRFVLPMPDRNDRAFTHYKRGQFGAETARTEDAAAKQWEQATRSRWRALALCIKAKLEAVEAGISEFETEFLANIVLPDNSTVGAWVRPQIERVYALNRMPELLPGVAE